MNVKLNVKLLFKVLISLTVITFLGVFTYYQLNKTPKQIKYQTSIEKSIVEKLEKRKPTFENPLVIQDPYGTNKLSALVLFNAGSKELATITVFGKEDQLDYTYSLNNLDQNQKGYVSIPIVGLFPDHKNIIELTYGDQSMNLEINTDKLPSSIFSTEVITSKPELMKSGFTFVPRFANSLSAFDETGEVRFYSEYFHGRMIRELSNGNMLVYGPNSKTDLKRTLSRLYEIDAMGKIYKTYFVNDSIHHDFYELENGNLILTIDGNHILKEIANKVLSKVGLGLDMKKEQVLVEVNEKSKMINRWDMEDIVGYMPNLNYDLEHDWFHLNAVIRDDFDDSFLVSARHQNIVVKFDEETSEVKWILGDHSNPNFTEEQKDLLLTPIGDEFEWQYGQHAPVIIERNGDELLLMLFDNGNMRSFDKEKYVLPANNYSRAVTYKIDESNMTIEQIFEYGKERGSELFSSYVGDVDVLEKEHYLFSFTGVAYDKNMQVTSKDYAECDNCGEYVFIGGSVIEYLNGEVIYEIKTLFKENSGVMTYRAERLSLENSITDFIID